MQTLFTQFRIGQCIAVGVTTISGADRLPVRLLFTPKNLLNWYFSIEPGESETEIQFTDPLTKNLIGYEKSVALLENGRTCGHLNSEVRIEGKSERTSREGNTFLMR